MGRPLETKASADVLARYEGNRTGKRKVGRCVLATRAEGRFKRPFKLSNLRLREIEQLISSRHGQIVPENDDDSYILAAAFALNALCRESGHDLGEVLRGWCHRWTPWALPRAGEILRPILHRLANRKMDLNADEVASLLRVNLWERTGQDFKTIGAYDVPPEIRKQIACNEKKRKDRERLRAKRRAAGVQPRDQWEESNRLSKLRPWEAEGISRSTWYRRQGRTGPSRVGNNIPSSDTLVSLPQKLGTAAPFGSPAQGVVTPFKSPSTRVGEVPTDTNEVLIRIGVSS